jgi:hypothetical protein
VLLVGGVVLVVAAAVLGSRWRARSRVARQANRDATERWEDEGGAVRTRPS